MAFGVTPVVLAASVMVKVRMTGDFDFPTAFPSETSKSSDSPARMPGVHMQLALEEEHTMARRRMTTRSATYLLRLTPEEKSALEERAALAGMTLADALREGAHDLLRRKNVRAVPGERDRRHAAAR